MESAGLSGASGPTLEDYSVYTNLSDEELIQIAIERSLSGDHDATPSTDTRPTPCPPNAEVRQPSTPHLHSNTRTQPGTQHLHSTSEKSSSSITAHYSSHNPPTEKTPDVVENPLTAAIWNGDANRVRALVKVPGCNLVSSAKPVVAGWLVIHQAAAFGQEACLRELLTAQPGMLNKKTNKKAMTALMLAVAKEHASCVRLLLERGADLTIVNSHRETPLYKACERGNVELVATLLSHGASVHTPCSLGRTVLHAAVLQNNVEICEMLVKAGAKISTASIYGMTPLSEAAQSGTVETLRFLLKHGADINGAASDGATPLYEACKNGHVSTVEVLLSLKADVNRSKRTGLLPIHVAVQNCHSRIVSLLIPVTSRKRIIMSGISPLHIAAERNRNNIMELLLEAGFDPNCQLSEDRRNKYADHRSTALFFSVYNSNLEAVEMLLEAGANPNLDLFNPLLVLKLLLDHGCNARSCFYCDYGSKPHPTLTHSDEQRNWNSDAPWSRLQFCEAVSKPSIRHLVGPLVSLLLNYVSHVRLCSRLMEHLVSSPLWTEVKIKAVPPHPLMQLCRLRIRRLVGVGRLKLLRDLDLPSRLIKFLCYEEDCCSLYLDT